MLDWLIYVVVGLVAVTIPAGYISRYRRHMAQARQKQEAAIKAKMTEPASLHPKIDPNRCIASGGCTEACPEGGIIGILDGRAELVTPTKCIGHGACLEACPVDAITLVFGTATRGVEIPHVKQTFETNVQGIYIAGELGGMGLIRNAVTQGRQAVEYIAKGLPSRNSGVCDLIIVGAGPAGMAAALQAKQEGLKAMILEQGEGLGGTILSYPRQKLVMTQPMEIPLHGPFKRREIQKEELLELWEKLAREHSLAIQDKRKVASVERQEDHYLVTTDKEEEYTGRRVLLAIGRRGSPRQLGVPGEQTSKVTYRLLEPEQYRNKRLLVVGGGDSAIEAAIALAEQQGTQVSLSYRKDVFSRIKERNLERISNAMEGGLVMPYMESQVGEIGIEHVLLQHRGKEVELENDYVFVFIGGVPPTAFLQNVGIQVEKKFGVQ